MLVPLIFIASLLADDGGPEGIPFGDYVRESGLAIPLVGLFFGAFWFFPLITALVAGDIVATEDGTRFTNDDTGRGMVVAIEGVETF